MYMYYIYVGECRVLPRYYGRSTNTAIANYYQLVVSLLHHIARDYFNLYHLIVFKHNIIIRIAPVYVMILSSVRMLILNSIGQEKTLMQSELRHTQCSV